MIIGIDLGTTNSLISYYKDGEVVLIKNQHNNALNPSVVSIFDDKLFVGNIAKEHLVLNPNNTASVFKPFMGSSKKFSLNNKLFLAEELSALVLKDLKKQAEEHLETEVTEAIISVPAYFNDNQRCATKHAAKLAGLNVTRLINEPSAAAIYYQHKNKTKESKLLILDFGGGTFDVSVCHCYKDLIEIIAISGDNHLGGEDINNIVLNYFCQHFNLKLENIPKKKIQIFLDSIEYNKKNIKENMLLVLELDKVYELNLTKNMFYELCMPLFVRIKNTIVKAFKNCRLHPKDITDVVLVGGSSKFELYIDFLEGIFKKRPNILDNTDEIVGLGVGLYTGIKSREIKDVVMTDVCPFSLGIGVSKYYDKSLEEMSFLIDRSSILPTVKRNRYVTSRDYQKKITCKIFQGESNITSKNLKLGEISINVPPNKAGAEYVDITFMYDIDGILQVEVENAYGDVKNKIILNENLALSAEDVSKKIKKLEKLKIDTFNNSVEQLNLIRLHKLFEESSGKIREHIGNLIAYYEQEIYSDDKIVITKINEVIAEKIIELEDLVFNYQLDFDFSDKKETKKYDNMGNIIH